MTTRHYMNAWTQFKQLFCGHKRQIFIEANQQGAKLTVFGRQCVKCQYVEIEQIPEVKL